MTQVYSNPERENDTHALPDVEVFAVSPMEAIYNQQNADHANEYTIFEPGWYWWWDGDVDTRPVAVSVLYSPMGDIFFATRGQLGGDRAHDLSKLQGFWQRLVEPAVPDEPAKPDVPSLPVEPLDPAV